MVQVGESLRAAAELLERAAAELRQAAAHLLASSEMYREANRCCAPGTCNARVHTDAPIEKILRKIDAGASGFGAGGVV